MSMKPFDYLLLQLALEGIRHLSGNTIAPAFPGMDDFPLVISARTSDGEHLIAFDELLPGSIRRQLPEADLRAGRTDTTVAVLEKSGIPTRTGHFKTYIFPDGSRSAQVAAVVCLPQADPRVMAFGFNGFTDQVFAIDQDGAILSACVSSRQNAQSAEAWVRTHADHRKKGLARQVVTAWAAHLQQAGLVPFYSHNIENTGSAHLARSLNLIPVFEETVIEKIV